MLTRRAKAYSSSGSVI